MLLAQRIRRHAPQVTGRFALVAIEAWWISARRPADVHRKNCIGSRMLKLTAPSQPFLKL